ncbi:MAG: hypothetical protein Q8R91_10850 [Candidatus Omnitrophota bacterium]|nr:hypothetical protein [Candidatus Omnitrophota bacterium]
MLRCGLCRQPAEGLSRYVVAGHAGLMVCARCYSALVQREHQPYAKATQRLYRRLGLVARRGR